MTFNVVLIILIVCSVIGCVWLIIREIKRARARAQSALNDSVRRQQAAQRKY